ncbi:MAG: SRPBCC domain-containing protein [Terriglobales bacterium]
MEVDPPRVLAYTWFANFHKDPLHPTLVRWKLTPTKSGAHVKVTHSGLAQLPEACTAYSQGWPGLLEALKTFSEK